MRPCCEVLRIVGNWKLEIGEWGQLVVGFAGSAVYGKFASVFGPIQSRQSLLAIKAVTACTQTMIPTQPHHPVCFQRQPGKTEPKQPPR